MRQYVIKMVIEVLINIAEVAVFLTHNYLSVSLYVHSMRVLTFALQQSLLITVVC